jgi:cytochrome c553
MTIEYPHCKVHQKVHIARRAAATKERQYVSCVNCHNEFDVKAEKIVRLAEQSKDYVQQ